MSDRIAQALTKLFERHRIVFWYDAEQELRSDFAAVQLAAVEKLELDNNEYRVKYKILREQPEQKFLLYHAGPQPADLDNWLLDVQLAQGEFRTDRLGIWLSEMELGLEFADLVQAHAVFFQADKRKDALKKLLQSDDSARQIRLKMLAVCVDCEPRLDAIIENLLADLTAGQTDDTEKTKLLKRCNLDNFLWEQMQRHYGYESTAPGIHDFALKLFNDCYFQNFTDKAPPATGYLFPDALVFLKRWKDSRQFEKAFEKISEEFAGVLKIEADLAKRDFRDLLEIDYFELIDRKIISDLLRAVLDSTISCGELSLWVRQRRQGHWYNKYQHLYEAIDCAAQFKEKLLLVGDQWSENATANWKIANWVERYATTWYQLDQLYRKFICNVRISGQASLMDKLSEQIENLYSNNYLLRLGDRFQTFVDAAAKWEAYPVRLQNGFFEHFVAPFLRKDNKVCVIISDGMRYEVGEELQKLIRQEDRFDAELQAMLAMLPSYTQLGMAALLPNKTLAIADNKTGTVLVDGQSSRGTANRDKILAQAVNHRGAARKANEVMAMNKEECRALLRDNDVIYVYHNLIDNIGDEQKTEERAFEAAEETMQELIRLIKKLTGANANNLLVTADHGFIYQNRAIDESDFSRVDIEGENVLFQDRRFVLGKGLIKNPSLHKFSSEQLGLAGELEVQIPKSINRLSLRGSGSRYVHGGASLQEVVIPVLKINKKRQSDVSFVEVEILRGTSMVITSGQLGVTMYQTTAVTEKIRPRILRAGIFTEAGELISDSHDLTFDLNSENPRERELQVRFMLSSKADEVNGQEVVLRLEEKHANTTHYKEYKALRYTMRRSFTSDFDF